MLSLVISCACSYVGAMSEKIVDQLLCRGYPCHKVYYLVMVHYTVRYTIQCDSSPICRPPGEIFGASGLTGPSGSGETVPNLFRIILGSMGEEGVSSTGVYSSQGVGGFCSTFIFI